MIPTRCRPSHMQTAGTTHDNVCNSLCRPGQPNAPAPAILWASTSGNICKYDGRYPFRRYQAPSLLQPAQPQGVGCNKRVKMQHDMHRCSTAAAAFHTIRSWFMLCVLHHVLCRRCDKVNTAWPATRPELTKLLYVRTRCTKMKTTGQTPKHRITRTTTAEPCPLNNPHTHACLAHTRSHTTPSSCEHVLTLYATPNTKKAPVKVTARRQTRRRWQTRPRPPWAPW